MVNMKMTDKLMSNKLSHCEAVVTYVASCFEAKDYSKFQIPVQVTHRIQNETKARNATRGTGFNIH